MSLSLNESADANIGTKSMQNTSAYEEPRSSGKWLHKYSYILATCRYLYL